MSLKAVLYYRKQILGGIVVWLQLASPTMAQLGSVAVDAEELEDDSFIEQQETGSEIPPSLRSGYSISLNYNSSMHFNGLSDYDKYCGSAAGMPQIKADKTAFYYGLPIKVGLGFGYFKDDCKTTLNKPEKGTDLVFTETGGTSLKMIPLQLTIGTTFELPSFPFFNIDMHTGFEHLIVEESRTLRGAAATTAEAANNDTTGTGLVISTSANSFIYNIGLNLLLNKLDEKSANSLYESLGLGKVYLRTFVESTIGVGGGEPEFDRLAMGIGFGFASGKP